MAKISSKIKPDSTYSIKDNTFLAIPKDNPKDLIQKEIGDSKVPTEFLPQTKIMRWDNEVNFSVRLVHDEASPVISKVGETVKWKGDKVEAHFYDINSEEHPEGASEFEIVLLEKPKTNVVQFTLVDKGVEYFYQPSLTEQEIADGASMPKNVIGSYAVYASENKTNYVGGKEYKCGKVGHIYRPQIEDSAGTKVWGELHIENGILSVTIPQDFLDTAVYPVKHAAGLTFGYTGVGASDWDIGVQFISTYAETVPSSGTMSKIQGGVYCPDGVIGKIKMAVYGDSSNVPGNLLANSISEELTVTRTTRPTLDSHWTSSTNVSGSIVNGNIYYVAIHGSSSAHGNHVCRDASTGTTSFYKTSTYATFPNDPAPSGLTNYNGRFSIYATYTAGGGSSAPTVTTQSVSSIASTTATGNGNVTADGGATVTERGVCWGTSTNPTIAGNHSAATAGGTGVFTASITSLSAKTHYYVRAYATNSVGTSYGDNVEFDTSGDFIVADESSASSLENIELTFNGSTFSMDNESSASNIDNIVLTRNGGDFVVADESSASSIDEITLQFQGNFEIADEESNSSIDNITIVRNGGDFVIANEESSSSIENISLIGNLQIDNAESESSIDNVTIERNGGDFIIEDAVSSSSVENISIQQSGTLLTADIETTSSIENINLEQNGGTLAVGDTTSTPEIENIALIGNFIIGDVVCETTTEEITLEFEGATFEISDISSTSTVENIPLIGELIIQDINAPPTIENIVINSLDISTMNKNVFITQGGLALQTGGLRIPTCITAERPTALKGSLIYNTELNSLEIYDGSNWVTV